MLGRGRGGEGAEDHKRQDNKTRRKAKDQTIQDKTSKHFPWLLVEESEEHRHQDRQNETKPKAPRGLVVKRENGSNIAHATKII